MTEAVSEQKALPYEYWQGEINYVAAALSELGEPLEGDAHDGSFTDMVTTTAKVREQIDALRIIADALEDCVIAAAPAKTFEVDGVGHCEIHRRSNRITWEDDTWSAVVAYARDERRIDPDTGEVLESEADAVMRVLKECAHVDYWRVQKLAARGIDADEYRHTEPGRLAVRWPARRGA